MARPKKPMAHLEPATERELAPVTTMEPELAQPAYIPPPQPRQMRVERQGSQSEPYVVHHPQVRGGVCEFCGVLDGNYPSHYQYKLCPHYRGMELRCSYCPDSKDPDDVVSHAILNITDSPDRPGVLVVCCDSYDCVNKHRERFKINS